jgi:hypothetical protein
VGSGIRLGALAKRLGLGGLLLAFPLGALLLSLPKRIDLLVDLFLQSTGIEPRIFERKLLECP